MLFLVFEKIEFDWKRNLEFLALGLGWLAPCLEIWYGKLLPRITQRYLSHMKKPKQICYRLLIDALVFAPIQYIGFYLFKDVLLREDRSKIDYRAEIM